MGFFSGIMLGIILGVALIAGWARAMARRAHKRSAKASAPARMLYIDHCIHAMFGSLNREDLKKICGENLPQWISFPEYDQVKWLNRQLSKLWPFVEEAATMVIRDSVEPILDVYRPVGISSLKFSRLSLGTVPPKIEGIRVQSFQKGQITMDIDFKWGGDPNIVLAVETLVASLPIQFKNLQVFTIIRVVFQLSDEIPCISAVVIALLAEPKPRIDYILKAVGGSLTAMPGLSDMIDDTVASLITDMLQWPHRIVVPLGVDVDISDLELKPHGKVTVTVVRGESLKNKEFIGKSDPYVVLFIRPMFKERTRVIDDNLNPEWNETFELIAEDKETQHIILEVFDEDSLKQDKRLGIVKLPLSDLEVETVQEINLQLLSSLDTTKVKDKKDRGVLTVRVLYHLYTKEEALRALELEKRTDGSGVHKDGPGVHMVGTGIDAVGKSITKAGKFVGRTVTGPFSSQRRSAASVPTIDE
ncbi:Extended synaptotagmin-2-A [Triticum urartu]|uniref:Extended synaptotagmin-2-A n=1 Tax=Triticum urartu TaxID=4572 RepID=M7ZYQ5_TRIUA|nr:Extended synaptotagmin-2-A [Triticum urartu]